VLPRTGSNATEPLLALGAGLLAAGVTMLAGRRRESLP
jgi:LPXTG-motif cell wall-anchored protein